MCTRGIPGDTEPIAVTAVMRDVAPNPRTSGSNLVDDRIERDLGGEIVVGQH